MVQNHFTATGIVFNSKNEVLMIHHNKLKVWLPPGGHIDDNELPDDAAAREIFEETGVRVTLLPTKHGLNLSDDHCRELCTPFLVLLENIERDWSHNHIDLVYLCRAINDDLTPSKREVNAIGWFSFADVKKLETFHNVSRTIELAEEYLKEHPDV